MWIHGCYCGHVLLAGENQLVVDHILGHVSKTVQSAGWMECHGHAGPEVNELANALHPGRLVVEPRADAFADHVPVRAAAEKRHLLGSHDVLELFANFLCSSEGLGMEEMLDTP